MLQNYWKISKTCIQGRFDVKIFNHMVLCYPLQKSSCSLISCDTFCNNYDIIVVATLVMRLLS